MDPAATAAAKMETYARFYDEFSHAGFYPKPYTLHPTPYTLHPTPYILHPKP